MKYAKCSTPDNGYRTSTLWLVSVALALVAIAGCGTACRCCRSNTASVASAPERVEIDGRKYTLTANAWRDFQPIAPPDGQPLVVVARVVRPLLQAEPNLDAASIDRIWVLSGKKQWSAKPENPSMFEAAVRGGPKWGPGIKVDVVARLKQGKQTWLVRAAGVEIKRTD